MLSLFNAFRRQVARFEVDVTTAGPVTFLIHDPTGLRLVVGEKVVEAQARTTLTLPQGVQPIALFGEGRLPQDGLRVELIDDPAAGGRARLVTGR
jgi:hypothetical protein